MVNNSKNSLYTVLLVTAALIIGALAGKHFSTNNSGESGSRVWITGNSKIEQILKFMKNDYVDSLDVDSISELAIINLLAQLDPHSVYMPPVDLEEFNTEMQGEFDGIGVEFNILRDSVVVANVLPEGPSSRVGLKEGDRIVKVDGEIIAGIGITNADVIKKLRGERGTKVNVVIYRPAQGKELEFTITRGPIPVHSVDNVVMLSDAIGYIKVSRFIDKTHKEFKAGIAQLKSEGAKKLIVDLRGNGGGYLNQAVDMIDELLADGLITYTQGAHRKRKDYKAKAGGIFEKGELVVLIDESSASASEVFAGAIQDRDRGLIVGRKSFGKGLVQEVINLTDGSAIRLTIARYYTPSGRCIQKPYEHGMFEYYFGTHKENIDSLVDAGALEKFYTASGRLVYESGGITPDIVVEEDSSGITDKTYDLWQKGIIYDVSFQLADMYRDSKSLPSSIDEKILSLTQKLAEEDLKLTAAERKFVLMQTKRYLSRNLGSNKDATRQLLKADKVIIEAIKAFDKYPF